jgi:hypothetical protein
MPRVDASRSRHLIPAAQWNEKFARKVGKDNLEDAAIAVIQATTPSDVMAKSLKGRMAQGDVVARTAGEFITVPLRAVTGNGAMKDPLADPHPDPYDDHRGDPGIFYGSLLGNFGIAGSAVKAAAAATAAVGGVLLTVPAYFATQEDGSHRKSSGFKLAFRARKPVSDAITDGIACLGLPVRAGITGIGLGAGALIGLKAAHEDGELSKTRPDLVREKWAKHIRDPRQRADILANAPAFEHMEVAQPLPLARVETEELDLSELPAEVRERLLKGPRDD